MLADRSIIPQALSSRGTCIQQHMSNEISNPQIGNDCALTRPVVQWPIGLVEHEKRPCTEAHVAAHSVYVGWLLLT